MPDLKDLLAKRNQLAADMRALNDAIPDGTTWTGEQSAKWEAMRAEYSGVDQSIKREEELRAIEQGFVEQNAEELRNKAKQEQGEPDPEKAEARAFDKYVRSGRSELTSEDRQLLAEAQKRAQAAGVKEKGGYTVPTTFLNKVHDTMKDYGGIGNICQLLVTDSGNTITWPTTDGTNDEGVLLGENDEADEKDIEFGSAELGACKLSSRIIRVSNELLSDAGVDIEGIVAARVGTRLGRAEARYLVQGTGTGTPKQPKGLEASAGVGFTAASATKFDWTEVNELIHSIDPAYRRSPQARLAFNDKTLKELENMKDAQGRPLWLPALAGGAPATILNYQYQVDQAIADIGADKKFMFFGDFYQFILRRIRYLVLRRLEERYAEYDQVGFIAFHRFDTVLQDANAIKALVGKAGTK